MKIVVSENFDCQYSKISCKLDFLHTRFPNLNKVLKWHQNISDKNEKKKICNVLIWKKKIKFRKSGRPIFSPIPKNLMRRKPFYFHAFFV